MLKNHHFRKRLKQLEIAKEQHETDINDNKIEILQNNNLIDTNINNIITNTTNISLNSANIDLLNNNIGFCATSNYNSNRTYSANDILEFNKISGSRFFSLPNNAYNINTYKYTIPTGESGKYLIGCKLFVNSQSQCQPGIFKNNTMIIMGGSAGSNINTENLHIVCHLNESDTLYVKIVTGSATYYMSGAYSIFYCIKM